jgi:hypothetical protein
MYPTAEPLSYLWTVKGAVDHVRAICSEWDDQIVTDDNIRGYLQNAIMHLHKLYPIVRNEYVVSIPFTTDGEQIPGVSTSTVPRASLQYRFPFKIKFAAAITQLLTPSLELGMYNAHALWPTNYRVLGWVDMYNTDTGSCRRTSDYSQLMGMCLGNNTQISRTVAWFAFGRNLWISVREKMSAETIVVGLAVRTVIPILRLLPTSVPTGIPSDDPGTPLDETVRHIPADNEWERLDIPDDYFSLVSNMAAIKVWGQVGKSPQESVEASVNSQLASLDQNLEMSNKQREQFIKATQWQDRGHL